MREWRIRFRRNTYEVALSVAESRALAETDISIPADMVAHLPKILWLYQMGLILFWIYDRSEGQARTMRLSELVEILES